MTAQEKITLDYIKHIEAETSRIKMYIFTIANDVAKICYNHLNDEIHNPAQYSPYAYEFKKFDPDYHSRSYPNYHHSKFKNVVLVSYANAYSDYFTIVFPVSYIEDEDWKEKELNAYQKYEDGLNKISEDIRIKKQLTDENAERELLKKLQEKYPNA